MMDDKIQTISVRLTGDNYQYWAHIMKDFVVGKGLWGYVSGAIKRPIDPTESDPKKNELQQIVNKWDRENAQLLTWFHNSVQPSIGMNFSKYDTAQKVWKYLRDMYVESNFAKHYELEMSIRGTKQNDKSIMEFYSEMASYWDQLTLMEPAVFQTIDEYVQYREKQRLIQFLMALRDQFEPLRDAILHRSPLLSMDRVVHELIVEETRLKVHHISPPAQSVFATSSVPRSQIYVPLAPILPTPASHLIQVTDKSKPQIPLNECSYCHQKGHWKHSCPNRGQSKVQKGFSRSSLSSQVPQQHLQQGTQHHSRSSTALATPASSDTPLPPSFAEFQQNQAFWATIQGDSTQISAMTTTHSECLVEKRTLESEDLHEVDDAGKQEDGSQVQAVLYNISGSAADTLYAQKEVEAASRAQEDRSVPSDEKHSISVEVGASLMCFIKGKWGSPQEKIEEELGVKMIFPSSKEEDAIIIEGVSAESVNRASDRVQGIIDEVVKSPNLDYSHFISLPLALHPELVDKLVNFQKSVLGDTSENEGLGIERSIFIKPKTFHLTVLMLKLWNKARVDATAEVLRSVSSKVVEALEGRPVSVRLKGLECMKGSLAKARVLYAPVEEIGNEGRLLLACKVITDAFVEAGLVLEKDAQQKLKLHATVMNERHRKRTIGTRKLYSFDARGIIKQFGSEEWGEYLIREAHLSQMKINDQTGYYHCCASIPFPVGMQLD